MLNYAEWKVTCSTSRVSEPPSEGVMMGFLGIDHIVLRRGDGEGVAM